MFKQVLENKAKKPNKKVSKAPAKRDNPNKIKKNRK